MAESDLRIRHDERLSLRERVYQRIKEAVATGRFKPGEQMLEEELAHLLGVSRTPIREALQRLEAEGYLTIVPRRGIVFGSIISSRDFEQISEVREALEGLAAQRAARAISHADLARLEEILQRSADALEGEDLDQFQRLNTLFHEVIIQASGNDRLVRTLETMRDEIQRYRNVSSAIRDPQPDRLREHEEILRALRARDAVAAREAMIKHLQANRIMVLQATSRAGSGGKPGDVGT